MRRSITMVVLLALSLVSRAQSLTIDLVLNRAGGGTLRLVLCPDEASFTTEKGCVLKSADAAGPLVRMQFPDLAPGTYAVKVFHDVNDNGVMDTNWMGIPREPYGFSNDAMGTFGPPDFEPASFKVGAGVTTVRIRMKG